MITHSSRVIQLTSTVMVWTSWNGVNSLLLPPPFTQLRFSHSLFLHSVHTLTRAFNEPDLWDTWFLGCMDVFFSFLIWFPHPQESQLIVKSQLRIWEGEEEEEKKTPSLCYKNLGAGGGGSLLQSHEDIARGYRSMPEILVKNLRRKGNTSQSSLFPGFV